MHTGSKAAYLECIARNGSRQQAGPKDAPQLLEQHVCGALRQRDASRRAAERATAGTVHACMYACPAVHLHLRCRSAVHLCLAPACEGNQAAVAAVRPRRQISRKSGDDPGATACMQPSCSLAAAPMSSCLCGRCMFRKKSSVICQQGGVGRGQDWLASCPRAHQHSRAGLQQWTSASRGCPAPAGCTLLARCQLLTP